MKNTRVVVIKVMGTYQIFDDGDLVATFYSSADAYEFAELLRKMYK